VEVARLVRSKMFLSVFGLIEGKSSRPLAIKAAIPSPSSSRDVNATRPSETGGSVTGKRTFSEEGYQFKYNGKASV
jgi:hypothetical protein